MQRCNDCKAGKTLDHTINLLSLICFEINSNEIFQLRKISSNITENRVWELKMVDVPKSENQFLHQRIRETNFWGSQCELFWSLMDTLIYGRSMHVIYWIDRCIDHQWGVYFAHELSFFPRFNAQRYIKLTYAARQNRIKNNCSVKL